MNVAAVHPRAPGGASVLNPEQRVLAVRAATIVALLLFWEVVSRSGLLYQGVIPSLLLIGEALGRLVASAVLYRHLSVTAYEVLAGMAIAASTAIPIGIFLGARPFTRRAAEPFVVALATTPKIVFLPIIMLFLGVGQESKVALGALSAFFPIVLSTTAGVLQVRPVHLKVAKSFNLSALQTVTKVYLPSLVQPILTGLRLGFGVCVIGVLLGEIKLSNAGLGFLASDFYNQYRVPQLYAVLILIFSLAVAANALMGAIARRLDRGT